MGHAPRAWLAEQEGFRARANAAQQNLFEVFPFFAVGVILAALGGLVVRLGRLYLFVRVGVGLTLPL